VEPTVVNVTRVYDELYPAESVAFPSDYDGYQLMRPRISHIAFPDILPPDFEGFNVSASTTVYVWSIATVSKTGYSAVTKNGTQVTAIGSLGNVWKLYSKTQASGAVTTWGANGVDAINGDITNLPPLYMVPAGITITNTPISYSWQTIGSSTSPVTADKRADYIDARYWNADTLSTTAPGNAVICNTVAELESTLSGIMSILRVAIRPQVKLPRPLPFPEVVRGQHQSTSMFLIQTKMH
jgi:hypothetical protein